MEEEEKGKGGKGGEELIIIFSQFTHRLIWETKELTSKSI
jgi:hypothetical protein